MMDDNVETTDDSEQYQMPNIFRGAMHVQTRTGKPHLVLVRSSRMHVPSRMGRMTAIRMTTPERRNS